MCDTADVSHCIHFRCRRWWFDTLRCCRMTAFIALDLTSHTYLFFFFLFERSTLGSFQVYDILLLTIIPTLGMRSLEQIHLVTACVYSSITVHSYCSWKLEVNQMSITGWREKSTVVCPSHESCSTKKGAKPWVHVTGGRNLERQCAWRKKPDRKGCILCDSIHLKF